MPSSENNQPPGSVTQSWALAVPLIKKIVFNSKAQVPSSENSLLLGKD